MVGVRKSNLNKGIVMRGGGRFGIKKFDFYFHEGGVLDKEVFDSVIAGKTIKYVDDLLWFYLFIRIYLNYNMKVTPSKSKTPTKMYIYL